MNAIWTRSLRSVLGTTDLPHPFVAKRDNDRCLEGAGRRYLALAGIFHLAITFTVFVLGRWKIFPSLFDASGAGRFASDSSPYLADTASLATQLRLAGIATWANAPSPLHTKIYSLVFAAFGPLFGFNILAVEPLNLFCYLAIILLVFKLGNEISGARTGLGAAILVAVWPTFLLHTTQILKEPLYISLYLGLTLVATCGLTRSLSMARGLGLSLLGGLITMLLWLVKPDLWILTLLAVLLSLGFQCWRFIRVRPSAKGNLIGGVTLLLVALVVPLLAPLLMKPYQNPNPHPFLRVTGKGASQQITAADPAKPLTVQAPSRSSDPLTRMRERITWARYLFANYPGTASNIDADVRLESWGEVVRYLPRAAEIGLLAPFPNMWFASGAQVGRLGRILSGIEILIMYLVLVLIGLSFWKRRGQLASWFLITIATLSVIVLGLVIANIGALYRMRYPFWILLIIVGVDSALRVRVLKR